MSKKEKRIQWMEHVEKADPERRSRPVTTYIFNDGERVFLKQNLGQICNIVGMEISKDFYGRKVFAAHMPTQETIDALANSKKYDIILSGHTHNLVNKKYDNGVLVLNPGEACGYLSGKATFAIINTEKIAAEIIEL